MNWILLTPELTLLIAAALFLVMACLKPDAHRNYQLAVTLAAFTVAAAIAGSTMHGDLLNHVYRVDLFSQVFKALLAIGFFLVVVLCDDFQGVAEAHHGEGAQQQAREVQVAVTSLSPGFLTVYRPEILLED